MEMTKKLYCEASVELEGEALTVEYELADLTAALDAGEPVTEEVADRFNELNDRVVEIEIELHWLLIAYERRNWTQQDHAHHDLVMQNID